MAKNQNNRQVLR